MQWKGQTIASARVYSSDVYKITLTVLPITAAIGAACALGLRVGDNRQLRSALPHISLRRHAPGEDRIAIGALACRHVVAMEAEGPQALPIAASRRQDVGVDPGVAARCRSRLAAALGEISGDLLIRGVGFDPPPASVGAAGEHQEEHQDS
jgi:hypothetical protein